MKYKNSIYKVIAQTVILFVFIGIIEFLIVLVIGFASIGDEALPENQINFNRTISNVVGFPVSLFIKGFPLFVNGKSYEDHITNGLLPLNTLTQSLLAIGVVYLWKRSAK